MITKAKAVLAKMPSIFWVILLPLGLVGFIGGIIGLFFLLANVEGVASIAILAVTFLIVWSSRSTPSPVTTLDSAKSSQFSGLALAMGIVFFALMGMAIDQPGNFIYNKPLEIFFCPAETTLTREAIVSHPLPGRTDITQGFYCVNSAGAIKFEIDMLQVILVRFVEYIVIGYGLIYFSRFLVFLEFKRREMSD